MPLDKPTRDRMKTLYGRLADRPLEPGDPLYEPLYDTPIDGDPVSLMMTHINFSDSESIQLFSGFRGTGKTTELLRLKKDMEDGGAFVVYSDALDYVNPSEPIDIAELLIALAGAFSDQIEQDFEIALGVQTFWSRLTNFITGTEVRPTEISANADYQTPAMAVIGGIKAGIDLKFELRSGSTFRDKLQKFLSTRLKELKDQVDDFFAEGVRLIRKARGPDTQLVFLFDQLEQMRGTLEREEDVIRSVERIFAIHIDMLKIPFVHVIYTAPPWLKFRVPSAVRHTILPTVHLWRNDPARSRDDGCWQAYRSLVERRVGAEGLMLLFGKPDADNPLVDRFIDMSGGQIRDLLRLFGEAVLRAAALPSLPVTAEFVEKVVSVIRSEFLPIAQDDAKWLDQIARIRSTALPSTDAEPVNRLSRFLDNHLVLYFKNGNEWYDVHPLIRDEIDLVIQASGAGGA